MSKYLYLITTLIFLTISFSSPAAAAYQSGAGTQVKASIPQKVDIRIFGYTAPNSLVQATSVRVFAQVSSDKTGYFLIDPLPISIEAREICLTTIDSSQRYGFPLCVSLPETDKPTEIGPLLLSPTISLTSAKLVQKQALQSQAAGQTLPGSLVEIYFFDNAGDGSVTGKITSFLIPPVEAKSIPKLTTKTDKNGNFSISLPTNKVVAYRLFAKAFYEDLPTPKSQTLVFTVSSYINWWLVNILPKIILLALMLAALAMLAWYEAKTKKLRILFARISERQLKPFGVRTRLTFRRIWYNFRGYWRSHQTLPGRRHR